MFGKVLVANRGAIANRILRTLRKMGIASVCVYSEADRDSRPVLDADEAFFLGPSPATQSYLSIDRILAAAEQTGAQAIHPGYGFLSENVEFARECAHRGIVFIGPRVEQIEAFALKHTARALAERCGVPLLPGTGVLKGLDEALGFAEELRYPVMLKSSAGGGGIGMRVCPTQDELRAAYESVVQRDPANVELQGHIIEVLAAMGQHDEAAQKAADLAVQTQGRDPSLALLRAALRDAGDDLAVSDLLGKLYQQHPNIRQLLFDRIEVLRSLGYRKVAEETDLPGTKKDVAETPPKG